MTEPLSASGQMLLRKFEGDNQITANPIWKSTRWIATKPYRYRATGDTELEAVRNLCKEVGILCEL